MTEESASILIVEDSRAYAVLIGRAFKSANSVHNLIFAEDLETARAIIAAKKPDLVIADYCLLDGSGTQLLDQDQGKQSYAVIVMTSCGNEQIAADAIKAGALDYIVKTSSSLAALPETADRVIREWRHLVMGRKAEKALRESEERYRKLFGSMLEGYALCRMLYDDQGRPVDWIYIAVNNAFEILTGLKGTIGKGITEVIPELKDSNPELFEIYGRVAKTGESTTVEAYIGPLKAWLAISVYSPEKDHFVAIFHDISQRKIAEQSLLRSESEKRTLLNSMQEVVIYKDTDYRITWANKITEQVFNTSVEQMIGRKCFEVFHGKDSPCEGCPAAEVKMTCEPCEVEMNSPDGAVRFIKATPVFDAQGKIEGILEVASDITERKKAEFELRESERRYREILEKVKLISISLDSQGNVTFCNDHFLDVTGWKREEVIGNNWFECFVPSETREEIWPVFLMAFPDGGIPTHVENEIVTKLGEKLIISWSNVVLRDTNEKVIGTTSLGEDITERKRAEDKLRESQRLQDAILDNIPDIAWLKDKDCAYLAANESFARSCGYDLEDLPGKTDFDCWPDDLAEKYRKDDREIMSKGERVLIEEQLVTADGNRITIETFKTPIINDRGETIGITGIARDITQRKHAEKELQLKTALLEAQTEAAPDGILVVNSDRKCISSNRRFGEMFQIPQELLETRDDVQILKFALTQLKDPEDFVNKVDYLYLHPEEITRDEFGFKDGKIFERYSSPLTDQTGNLGRIWFFRDITELRQAESKRRVGEEKYRTLFECSQDALMTVTPPAHNFTSCNPACLKMFRAESEEEFIKLGPGTYRPNINQMECCRPKNPQE